jgi:flagellar biosynthesis component FlhA
MGEVLRTVLDLRIGIRDRERIASLIPQSGAATAADAAEYIIDGMRSATVDIHVEPGYLEEITTAGAGSGGSIFPYLRDSLYVELGLRLPSLRLVPAPELAPRCFAFRVNDIATPVVVGLPAQTCLVSAPSARLAEVTPGVRAALNPEGDVAAAFVPEAMREELERQGYTTWDPLGHLVLALAETARLHARALIDRKTITHELDLLGTLLPALVRSVQAKVPLSRLTRLIRSLLDERVSVRDLPRLLQALIDQAEISGLPESDAELLVVARRAARPAITRAAMVQGSIYAYLLDPAFEAGAAAAEVTADKPVQEIQHSLVEALDNELAPLPSTATTPVLLTNPGARLQVRHAIAAAWPRIPVLAYDELDAMVNVMPVARLSPATP